MANLENNVSERGLLLEIHNKLFGDTPVTVKSVPSGTDGNAKTGVCNGTDDAVTSNTVDLANPGYFEVTGNAGNVKFDPVEGTAGQTRAFEAKVVSKFRVKRIYTDGTTATGIVIYF